MQRYKQPEVTSFTPVEVIGNTRSHFSLEVRKTSPLRSAGQGQNTLKSLLPTIYLHWCFSAFCSSLHPFAWWTQYSLLETKKESSSWENQKQSQSKQFLPLQWYFRPLMSNSNNWFIKQKGHRKTTSLEKEIKVLPLLFSPMISTLLVSSCRGDALTQTSRS